MKSVASAETLVAGDAIDEGKIIVKACNELLNLILACGSLLTRKTCFQQCLRVDWQLIDPSVVM